MATLFLDLDGTLINPQEGITRSAVYALEKLGLDAPAPETLTWMIGPALIDSFAQMGAPDPQSAVDAYRERYSTLGLFEATPYPGIMDALDTMAQTHKLCLATAKPHVFATRITETLALDTHLAAQFGPELDGTRNDKGALLAHALEQLGTDPADCIMIGDRHHDIDAAKAVGMRSVAVTWGFGTAEEHMQASTICHAVGDLPGVIEAMIGSGHGLD